MRSASRSCCATPTSTTRPVPCTPRTASKRHRGGGLRRHRPLTVESARGIRAAPVDSWCLPHPDSGRPHDTYLQNPDSRVAVVGATGQVGGKMLEILDERDFPIRELRLFASSRSAGKTLTYRGTDVIVEDVESTEFEGIDIALFSAGGGPSKQYAPRFAAAGATVVRQLERMAQRSRGSARRQRGQPARDRWRRQRHHRESELHDYGGHAGPQGARRRGRSRTLARVDVPGRVRIRPLRRRGAARSGRSGRQPGRHRAPRARWIRDRLPRAQQVRCADRIRRDPARGQPRR